MKTLQNGNLIIFLALLALCNMAFTIDLARIMQPVEAAGTNELFIAEGAAATPEDQRAFEEEWKAHMREFDSYREQLEEQETTRSSLGGVDLIEVV